jgi:hypothetical protein
MNRITLFTSDGIWKARFSGPHRLTVRNLFGTDTLETPFLSNVSAERVRQEIASRNPDAKVVVEQEKQSSPAMRTYLRCSKF